MTALFAIVCILLIAVIVVQIGRVTELAAKIRGEEEVQEANDRANANISLIFMVLFLVGCIVSAVYYSNWMLGYGPHQAASVHGSTLDYLFNVTLFFTGIVFVVTQVLLFWFAYKYRAQKGRQALYMPHDNKLEVVWTVVPAIVMTFLVVGGLDAWNEVMADVEEGEEYIEIEATGMQFAWLLRYPGPDNKLGEKEYTRITGINPLGQNWEDRKNLDDFHSSEIVLPVGKKVRVRITSRDVLHNFYLPHFRVKMDAIPGLPTYFVFTPAKTTEEYRQELKKYPEYNVPYDPEDPESPMMWEAFNYELACAELCGKGHYSMRKLVKIVSEEEYEDWLTEQQSYFMTSIRGTEEDPYQDELLDVEVQERKLEFSDNLSRVLRDTTSAEKILRLKYVTFETGSANLTSLSSYELDNLASALNKYPNMTIELAGHTDNTGEADANQVLSQSRAESVYSYLVGQKGIEENRLTAVGYGQNKPIQTNDTDAGRQENRRTEFKIITQ